MIACDSLIQAFSDLELAFEITENEPVTVDDAFKIAVRLLPYHEMRDDERDRARSSRGSVDFCTEDQMAEFMTEQFKKMLQIKETLYSTKSSRPLSAKLKVSVYQHRDQAC